MVAVYVCRPMSKQCRGAQILDEPVEASDELDNPGPGTLRERTESEPFLLDNHAPRVSDLRFAGGRLSGMARDELGPVSSLEYAVDGQEFLPFYPKDDSSTQPMSRSTCSCRRWRKAPT